ncbi:hypothetical protein F441_15729 [Phytophthora nicotianae CJ01A1]|uniref:Uncharacterized protein n=1 Tax=Phytophthora nicotianae CJ01A1 TaxID=1317063 RepID=W2WCD4_PHYNI|nr:hypothetical protein F441_15729 [Phytophthora nicotianae CJ01A1]
MKRVQIWMKAAKRGFSIWVVKLSSVERPACPLDARPMVSAMAFAIELAVSTFLVAFG